MAVCSFSFQNTFTFRFTYDILFTTHILRRKAMKHCPRCGQSAFDDASFCSRCGSALPRFDNTCNPFSTPFSDGYYEGPLELSHKVLSFLMPIYGFAYWFFKRMESPWKARTAMKVALISIGLYFAMIFFLSFLLILLP